MPGLVVSLVLLMTVLGVAIVRPHRGTDSFVAISAAVLLLVSGVVDWSDARDELRLLAPVLIFLAAVLVLGACCAYEGVFVAVGRWLARRHSGGGRLLLAVFVVAAVVTSVLSLDATVVLLTPVVLSAAGRLGVSPRPYVYATGHVANSGSLLLPTGNLTNLLALSAAGLTLVHFAGLMLLPWLAVLALEYGVHRVFFRDDLARSAVPTDHDDPTSSADAKTPTFAFIVLAATLAGFVATSIIGVEAYWAAVGGALLLSAHVLLTRQAPVLRVLAAMDVQFLLFVIGLAVVVRAAVENGLGDAFGHLLPANESLAALVAMAGVGAVLANLVNNLPALLILLPTAGAVGSLAVLAVLIGVNVGPNLTYPGSLATLLWRRVLRDHDLVPSLRRFTVLGLLTVPAGLAIGVTALWTAGLLLGP
jgi:arsenical pump membrane protein